MYVDQLCRSCDETPKEAEHHGECDRCGQKDLVGFVEEVALKVLKENK